MVARQSKGGAETPDAAERPIQEAVPTPIALKAKAMGQKFQAPWEDSAAEQDTIPAFGGFNRATSIITAPDFGGVHIACSPKLAHLCGLLA